MARRGGAGPASDLATRILWPVLALPGIAWLAMLFLVPFYALLALTFSTELDYFGQPVPTWSPLEWDGTVMANVVRESIDGIYTDSWIRTFWYCGIALSVIVLIGYPIAYYVARMDARRRGPLLLLLMAPWWINYLTRMLAWTGLLNDEGVVNRLLGVFGVGPVFWLSGRWWVVVIALIYGYLPYFIVPLYAYLDWIDVRHLEASRDLGANGARTFFHVTLPLSRVGLMTSLAFVTLPMFSDFYTNTLVSQSPATYMVGNQVVQTIYTGFSRAEGASLVLLLSALLGVVMAYYLVVTVRESREG